MQKLVVCTFISIVCGLLLNAQSIQLENLRVSDKESKTVYIGIDNHFAIKGNGIVKNIIRTEGVVLNKDKLLVRVNMVGTLPITFITENGKEVITFEKKIIPYLEFSKTALLQQRTIRIIPRVNKDKFWEGYAILSFQAVVNGTIFQEKGQTFSAALTCAVQQTKAGDEISISNVKVNNKDLQRDLNLAGMRTFIINQHLF